MYCFFDAAKECEIINISPGEYFVSTRGMPIHTVIGSCFSVAIHDPELKIGGMNNFLVPESDLSPDETGSMELLLDGLLKHGSKISDLEAKILGGSVFSTEDEKSSVEGLSFIKNFLNAEKIKIVNTGVGENFYRKIYFYPDTFRVQVKKLEKPEEDILKKAEEYKTRLRGASVSIRKLNPLSFLLGK